MQNKQQGHVGMPNTEWIELLSRLQQDNPEFQDYISNIIVFLKDHSISTQSATNPEEDKMDL